MGYARPGCRIVSGSINFDDVDMVKASEDQLKKMRGVRVAYVAQSAAASFNPAHRIVQQFAETPVVHKVMGFSQAEQKSKDLFKSLDLPDPDNIGRRFPHQVSGGQLQRAMVAMAMSCDPDLIIFDEPTTALDVTTQIEVWPPSRMPFVNTIRRRSILATIWPLYRRLPTGLWCCVMAMRSRPVKLAR